jgi:CRP-like cAMP-binding protein
MKFEPMRLKEGQMLAKKGSPPMEVFFLLMGTVFAGDEDKSSFGSYYQKGSMFGETDIIFERDRVQNFKAKEDCYILKQEK